MAEETRKISMDAKKIIEQGNQKSLEKWRQERRKLEDKLEDNPCIDEMFNDVKNEIRKWAENGYDYAYTSEVSLDKFAKFYKCKSNLEQSGYKVILNECTLPQYQNKYVPPDHLSISSDFNNNITVHW